MNIVVAYGIYMNMVVAQCIYMNIVVAQGIYMNIVVVLSWYFCIDILAKFLDPKKLFTLSPLPVVCPGNFLMSGYTVTCIMQDTKKFSPSPCF